MENKKIVKIVLSGGPSSGKSSTLEAFSKLNPEVPVVPEVATLLLRGGFPRPKEGDFPQRIVFQRNILNVQYNLEEITQLKHPSAKFMVLDRGSLDGVAYWPTGYQGFLKSFNLTLEGELGRYDHVLFFKMPAQDQFAGVGPERIHDYKQSCEIAKRQHEVWSKHKNFTEIPCQLDIHQKCQVAVEAIQRIVGNR